MIQEMTTMRIAVDKEKEASYENPLFSCNAYFTDWHHGAVEGIPWHWHKELELMYVSQGQAVTEYDDHQTILEEGDGFFCNAKTLHQIHIGDCISCRINYLVFAPELITGGRGTIYDQKYVHPLISDDGFPGCFLHLSNEKDKTILEHIQEAHRASREEFLGFEYDVRYHISRALLLLFHANQKVSRMSRGLTAQAERAKTMLEYIHANFAEPISIRQLAAHSGTSEREVQRCFSAVLHMSPMHYVQRYRIQVAGELLLNTADSILNVAIACGFSNPSHFSKAFRACYNCTPQKFRKRNSRKHP